MRSNCLLSSQGSVETRESVRKRHSMEVNSAVAALVALPATLFFGYVVLHGMILLLKEVFGGVVKGAVLGIVGVVIFLLTFRFFSWDDSILLFFPGEQPWWRTLHVTWSHTVCLAIGVLTSCWIGASSHLPGISRALFHVILVSMFYIGCFVWSVLSFLRSRSSPNLFSKVLLLLR